jgi:hypothetical protein
MVEEPHTQPNVTDPDLLPTLTKKEPHPEWVEWFKENSIPRPRLYAAVRFADSARKHA